MEIAVVMIALATLVVAIPPAITAMRDLGWIAARKRVIALPPSSSPILEGILPNSADRVLLTLKPERAAIPGTAEHDLMNFENRLPASYRSEDALNGINTLIRNPGLIRWSASSKAGANKWALIYFSVLGVAMGMTIAYYSTSVGAMVMYVAFLIPVIALIVFAYIDRIKNLTAVAVVDEYLNYLRANQIDIGIELTQSKAIYERRGAVSVAA